MTRISLPLSLFLVTVLTSYLNGATFSSAVISGWADGEPIGPPDPLTVFVNGISGAVGPGGGTITIDILGNFESASEFAVVSANPSQSNLSLGSILNNNSGDDSFDFNGGTDVGTSFMLQSGTAVLSQSALQNLIDEGTSGTIEFLITFQGPVADNATIGPPIPANESIQVHVFFEEAEPNPAPEPSTLILGGMAALLLGAYTYRRRRGKCA